MPITYRRIVDYEKEKKNTEKEEPHKDEWFRKVSQNYATSGIPKYGFTKPVCPVKRPLRKARSTSQTFT